MILFLLNYYLINIVVKAGYLDIAKLCNMLYVVCEKYYVDKVTKHMKSIQKG